jgi:hypothetical protein
MPAAPVALPKTVAVARGNLQSDVTAKTPAGLPDVRVVVLPALYAVLVRAIRTYLQSFLGFLGAGALGVIPSDPLDPRSAWAQITLAAGLALFPAFVALIQNIAELFAQLDSKAPEWRA